MEKVKHEYRICSAYLPYIINGDCSGLEDHEIKSTNLFLDSMVDDAEDGQEFMYFTHEAEETQFARCSITGLYADTATLIAVYRKEQE